MPRSGPMRIAVLGAGPIGLEAALVARALGYPVTVYERGRVAEHVQRWGHMTMFTPFGQLASPLGRAALRLDNPKHDLPAEADLVSGRDYVATYLEPLAMTGALIENVKLDTLVVQIGRSELLKSDSESRGDHPFRFLLREQKGSERIEEADIVLDCTGVCSTTRWMGEGGIPAIGEVAARAQIASAFDDVLGADRAKYAGKSVLIVGAGHSAATQVVRLAELAEKHPEMWIVWLARGPRSQPMPRSANDPFRERDRLAGKANMLATRGEGNVEFHASSGVQEIQSLGPDKGFRVVARVAGKSMSWDVDRIISCTGFQPDPSMTRELRIDEPLAPPTAASLKSNEPNYFVLGNKSYGRNSRFFVSIGLEQVRSVFALISGRSDPFGGQHPEKLIQKAAK